MTSKKLIEQYNREYDRIRKQISRMEKRGYDVTGLKPKRVAKKDITKKDVEKLKKLTNEDIYKMAGGETKKSEEASRRAKKGWRTRRRLEDRRKGWEKAKETHPEAPRIPHKLPRPEKPAELPDVDYEMPEGEIFDEYQAAYDRFYDDLSLFYPQTDGKMDKWLQNVISRSSFRDACKMLLDGYNAGIEFRQYAPSMTEGQMIDVQSSFENFLPKMSEKDRQMTEDEWQEMVQEIVDSEDYFDWD